MLISTFSFRIDEAAILITHYDPMARQDIRVQEFLDDVKELVQDTSRRLEIIDVVTSFSAAKPGSFDNTQVLRQQYAKDFEEMYKVMVANKSNAFQWFQIYSRQSPTRTGLLVSELQPAL